jgi:hypothetical protein
MSPIIVTGQNGPKLFVLEKLVSSSRLEDFSCTIGEYIEYLIKEAHQLQDDMIALTYLLYERTSGIIMAYMSLIADAIKLNATKKQLHNLNYPFKTLPAMKIAKLAAAKSAKVKYKGIGSYMILLASAIATAASKDRFACRFITVDADIEHDKGVEEFYIKNGFIPNKEMNNKNSKTINMRKDLFITL